jgi:glycosyltransferase involved in cell wall biosynthesis
LEALGYPAERISVVQNAIDAGELSETYESIPQAEVDALAATLGIDGDSHVALYCGRFYGLKDLDFTLECARQIRAADDRFVFLLVGDGIEGEKVRQFCAANAGWAHCLGALYGRDKARVFRLAACQLMPGAVGLNLVDSFATLTPMITRDNVRHGPEIEYLQDGRNGLQSAPDAEAYTAAVGRFFQDEALRARLGEGCDRARRSYTIENMAERFAEGIRTALRSPGYAPSGLSLARATNATSRLHGRTP